MPVKQVERFIDNCGRGTDALLRQHFTLPPKAAIARWDKSSGLGQAEIRNLSISFRLGQRKVPNSSTRGCNPKTRLPKTPIYAAFAKIWNQSQGYP